MKFETLRLLAEGGAAGHLMHLYDNPDLTFAEIKEILSTAATGELEKVTEKFDGMNLVFTWDASAGRLKVARATGDIKRGGMGAEELSAKFEGRGNLKKAFDSAFSILSGAISAVPPKQLISIFGEAGNRWYSIEVIYAENPNVINYDSNTIVFHESPIFEVGDDGRVQPSDDTSGTGVLSSYIDKMQAAVENRGWRVAGPAIVRLSELSNKTILSNTLASIDDAAASVGLGGSATLQEYLTAKMQDDVSELGIGDDIQRMVVDRALGVPNAPTLNDIKKRVDKSQYETVSTFVKAAPKLLQSYVRPIELSINDFAVELLRGLQSTLVGDTEKEVQRLRQATSQAIAALESSGDENAMAVLNAQMTKLKSLENISTPVEGVVFVYKGNAYKFTGSFASVNQILGLFRYGPRGGSKKSAVTNEYHI